MKLENIISITGMPGLFKLIGNRSNGLIVEEIATGKRQFVSMRTHQFSALESIAIYTEDDSVPLNEVFERMFKLKEEHEIPDPSSANRVKEYFEAILPEYDRDRVFPGDMKKVIKWYAILDKCGLVTLEPEAETKNEEEVKASEQETTPVE